MRNSMNIRELFNNNIKSIKHFLNWCKESQELCEYDYENLCVALELGATNKAVELFHFHTGNVLDYLEENGYYISLPVRGKFKYVTVVFSTANGETAHQRPLYNNSGVKDRNRALMLGVQRAIEDLETKL